MGTSEEYGAQLFQVSAQNPLDVTLGGRVKGMGRVLRAAVRSSTQLFLSTAQQGLLRIDLLADFAGILQPRISGAQEAPNNAVGHLHLFTRAGTSFLVAAEPTSVTIFKLF
jgi:hypothetical protein